MELRRLPGTEVSTTVLGFGCAGLFRLPSRRERRVVLEAVLAAGIRHFDVAPMYGLGRAEAELGPVLADRRAEVTVTTKFGIEPTWGGRLAGRAQAPVRAVLARLPRLQAGAVRSGRDAGSGMVGQLLYRSVATPATAEASLRRSLRVMGTGYVDCYAVHEPRLVDPAVADALARRLDGLRRDGLVRSWGLAGELPAADGPLAALVARAPLLQHRDDVFGPRCSPDGVHITYGALSPALGVLGSYLHRRPGRLAEWSERLQVDLREPDALAGALLRQAVRRNPRGVVLITTTRPERVSAAVAAVTAAPAPGEEQVLDALAAAAGAPDDASESER